MPKNNENASNANNSSVQARLVHETGTPLFSPEYIEFAEQLFEMCKWFLAYRDTVNPNDDYTLQVLLKIESALGDAAYNIGELVAIEFRDNTYYKDIWVFFVIGLKENARTDTAGRYSIT